MAELQLGNPPKIISKQKPRFQPKRLGYATAYNSNCKARFAITAQCTHILLCMKKLSKKNNIIAIGINYNGNNMQMIYQLKK